MVIPEQPTHRRRPMPPQQTPRHQAPPRLSSDPGYQLYLERMHTKREERKNSRRLEELQRFAPPPALLRPSLQGPRRRVTGTSAQTLGDERFPSAAQGAAPGRATGPLPRSASREDLLDPRSVRKPDVSREAVDRTTTGEKTANKQKPSRRGIAGPSLPSSVVAAKPSGTRKGAAAAVAAATGVAAAAAATGVVRDKKRARGSPKAPPLRSAVSPSPTKQRRVAFAGVDNKSHNSLSSTGRKYSAEKARRWLRRAVSR